MSPPMQPLRPLLFWFRQKFAHPPPPPSHPYSFYLLNNIWCAVYRVSQKECARLREGVPYVKVYRYNPKHLCPKLNGYGDNGQRKVWSSCGSTHCTCELTILSISVLECGTAIQLTLASQPCYVTAGHSHI